MFKEIKSGEIEMSQKRIRVPKKPIPSAKKIETRGLYEIMWGGKKRNYGERIKSK